MADETPRKRTYVADIERGVYDIKDKVDAGYTTGKLSLIHISEPTRPY